MKFTKMQATGNDFVVLDTRENEPDLPRLARTLCHRRFGVGSDGLILILPSNEADFRMRMFNPDGSEAEACGNGLRCFVRYVVERGIAGVKELRIETLAGIRDVRVDGNTVRVAMGVPQFVPDKIPVKVDVATVPVLDYQVDLGDRQVKASFVSMGNPHAVCFLADSIEDFPLSEVGPRIEHHKMFPNRTNFEIVNSCDDGHLNMRVWERGAGETLSCGSGVCAVAVAARLAGLISDEVLVSVPGGKLVVWWDGRGEVWLSGPAEIVFEGEWRK